MSRDTTDERKSDDPAEQEKIRQRIRGMLLWDQMPPKIEVKSEPELVPA